MKNEERIQLMLDKQEIQECIVRWFRGLDRHDADLARSAFHEDSRDDHGVFIGSGFDAVDWANTHHDNMGLRGHQHYITNFSIDVNGDEAHSESYVMVVFCNAGNWDHSVGGGRYLDRFERRDGRWGIVDRVVVYEWSTLGEALGMVQKFGHPFSQDKDDISYARPLRVTREPQDMTSMYGA
jgi:hypothetical protein